VCGRGGWLEGTFTCSFDGLDDAYLYLYIHMYTHTHKQIFIKKHLNHVSTYATDHKHGGERPNKGCSQACIYVIYIYSYTFSYVYIHTHTHTSKCINL